MRIGVFGGTFDPVHLGHLILAEQCREQGRLDQVLFVPAARPPHKSEQQLSPYAQRVEMLALAIAGQPAFRIDELEKDRPGPSYTADTLTELHRRRPDAEWFLLIGSDTLRDLPSWHDPARVAELAGLLVVLRPEAEVAVQETPRRQLVRMPLIDISSRDLRRLVTEGRSIRYMVPRAVEVYIAEKQLYRSVSGS
jgi:nicotinate-nucleotide adenylyltransferase